ncbi:MAG: beta-N-acetylhexosaminidase [Armatimonadetes bacterium]|nr:beta-N-acetylhexosaminidase [Armatimonadota bacterium]
MLSGLAWKRLGIALVAASSMAVGRSLRAESLELLSQDFNGKAVESPAVTLLENSVHEKGLVRSSSLEGWRRSGVQVGPVPVPKGQLIVEYDFLAVKFGGQCQEFTSQVPSTHWYMAFADPNGRLHLHTRQGGEWKQRATADRSLRLNTWYHERVALTRTSISLRIVEKESGAVVWETSEPVPVEDLGEETTFVLCDEAPTAEEGSTQWDNLRISTDDPSLAKQFAARMKAVATERVEQERRQRAAAELRRRGLVLVPMPQEVRLREGFFFLPAKVRVRTEGDCGAADMSAVQVASRDRLDWEAQALRGKGAADLTLRRGSTRLGAQSYRLEVGPRGVVLEARTPQGFFYAAQTLCQLLGDGGRVPCVRIEDAPAIENRLVMIAIDQGGFQLVDVDYWKRLLRELAAVKITHVMPYFEGAGFLYEKYPFITAKGENGFTRSKSRELSDYAHQRFLKIVPQQQCLGHSGAMLHNEQLKDLRESGDVFCSSNPKTFAFFGDLFDELVQAFPYGDYIHVGGDEFAHGFAQCPQCKARAEQIGKPGLYAQHMMQVRGLLKDRKRDMMIWWHEEGFTEEAADNLAKDLVVFDWHYGNQASYPSLERLQKKGFVRTWATPAVTRYYDPGNDFDNTFGNIQGFLRAAARVKAPGECTCTWVQGIWGGRNIFELNLYALLWSAECAWNPVASDAAAFRWKYAHHWFGLDGTARAEEVMDAVHRPYGSPKEQKFWRDNRELEPLVGENPGVTAKRLADHPELVADAKALLGYCAKARTILERWQKGVKRNRATVDFLLNDVHIHEVAAWKILAIDALNAAWAGSLEKTAVERHAALTPALTQLQSLTSDLSEIEAMYRRSVLEAGGGECGWGGWVPFITQGGILFRAAEGRKGIEGLLARVKHSLDTDQRSASPFQQ